MARQDKGLTWGLFILRFGLGGFLAVCAIDKIISPETTATLIFDYYLINVSVAIIMIIGGAELVLSLFFLMGMYKTWTYGTGFAVQVIAVATLLQNLLWPFGKNHLFLMLFPLLFAFGALFLMRKLDTKWTLTKKPSMFS